MAKRAAEWPVVSHESPVVSERNGDPIHTGLRKDWPRVNKARRPGA